MLQNFRPLNRDKHLNRDGGDRAEPTGWLTPDLAIASAKPICGTAPLDPKSQALELGGSRMELLEPWVRGLQWGQEDISLGPKA